MDTTACRSASDLIQCSLLALVFFVQPAYSQSEQLEGVVSDQLVCGEKTITVTNWAYGSSAQSSTDSCMKGLDSKCGGAVSDKTVTDGPNWLPNPPVGYGTDCEAKCKITWCVNSMDLDKDASKGDPLMQKPFSELTLGR